MDHLFQPIQHAIKNGQPFANPRELLQTFAARESPDPNAMTLFGRYLHSTAGSGARDLVWANLQVSTHLVGPMAAADRMFPVAFYEQNQAAVLALHEAVLNPARAEEAQRRWIALSEIMDRWAAVMGARQQPDDYLPAYFLVLAEDDGLQLLQQSNDFTKGGLVLIARTSTGDWFVYHKREHRIPLREFDAKPELQRPFFFDSWKAMSELPIVRRLNSYLGVEDHTSPSDLDAPSARLWVALSNLQPEATSFAPMWLAIDKLLHHPPIRLAIQRTALQHRDPDLSNALLMYRAPFLEGHEWFSAKTEAHTSEPDRMAFARFLGIDVDMNSAKALMLWTTNKKDKPRAVRWDIIRKTAAVLGLPPIDCDLADDDEIWLPTAPGILFLLVVGAFVTSKYGEDSKLALRLLECQRDPHPFAVVQFSISTPNQPDTLPRLQGNPGGDEHAALVGLRDMQLTGWSDIADRRDMPYREFDRDPCTILLYHWEIRGSEIFFLWRTESLATPGLPLNDETATHRLLAVYDNTSDVNSRIAVASQMLGLKSIAACRSLSHVKTCLSPPRTTLIAHFGGDRRVLQNVVDAAAPGTQIVLVSSVGFVGAPTPFGDHVRVFHLRPPVDELTEQDWHDMLSSLMSDNIGGAVIAKFFSDTAEELFALSIAIQVSILAYTKDPLWPYALDLTADMTSRRWWWNAIGVETGDDLKQFCDTVRFAIGSNDTVQQLFGHLLGEPGDILAPEVVAPLAQELFPGIRRPS
jgi:hypothetical protein